MATLVYIRASSWNENSAKTPYYCYVGWRPLKKYLMYLVALLCSMEPLYGDKPVPGMDGLTTSEGWRPCLMGEEASRGKSLRSS